GEFSSPVTGRFNALNMVVAIACGNRLGMVKQQILKGVASYLPPKRRMEEKGTWQGALVIDDFGHHPTAIKQTIDALLARYPGRRLIACFEPRSNTTTRNFYQQEILDCFDKAAAVAIGALDRPWRYQESERLDVIAIQQKLGKPSISISLEEGKEPDWGTKIYEWLKTQVKEGDLLVTFSNGDFGGLRTMLSSEQ
ncbi:MAG TPA: cyanophycin synthetase, partial [Fimbriimonas sp.]|nr:cyanophycin synthetase [Fimbriimonas sp.]